jgi:hypothetical protein
MYLDQQVCTLEQSQKLKSLGLEQSSIFMYVNNWKSPRNEQIDDGQHIIL